MIGFPWTGLGILVYGGAVGSGKLAFEMWNVFGSILSWPFSAG